MVVLRSIGAGSLLVGLLLAIRQFMGPGVFTLAVGLSALWFSIAFVLLTSPPNLSESQFHQGFFDPSAVKSRRPTPLLPVSQRLLLSFSVANALCLLLWVSLVVFRR